MDELDVDLFMEACEHELTLQYESGTPSSDLSPPPAVRAAAKRGLELRRAHKRGGWDSRQAHAGGMGSGVVRAQTLATGRNVSLDTVRRMRSFFARHDGERERMARQQDETSAANIAWLLWGGDPGRKWAEEVWARQSMNEEVALTEAAWWDKFVRRSLTREESSQLKVPKADLGCSVMHFTDKKGKELGFRAYTHRTASKFYPRVSDIPEKVLQFVSSTG